MKKRRIISMIIFTLMTIATTKQAFCIEIQKIIEIESSGNPHVVSGRNAIGLCQITSPALEDYNNYARRGQYEISDLFDPDINIKIGKWYIEKRIPDMLRAYKIPVETEMVLIAYNWGIGNFLKWYRSGADMKKLPMETRKYLIKYRAY